ncbi:ATP5S [Blepharisma stoltei]|uniref:dual-specificity kinase n=1 Tax=Blepharisma stoltei TaxID=1481888 RepID=A0AAU9JA91_9CILI|nr:unnamed protein product [Blepharisma stoltei]
MKSTSQRNDNVKIYTFITPRNSRNLSLLIEKDPNKARLHKYALSIAADKKFTILDSSRKRKDDISLPYIHNSHRSNISPRYNNATNKSLASSPNHTPDKLNISKASRKTSILRPEDFQPVSEDLKFPIASSQALKRYMNSLTPYEHGEILEYPKVYFLGINASKIFSNKTEKNYGFDDENSNYILITGDHLNYRYEILEIIGAGNCSQVCKCFDHKTKEIVAIKVVKSKPKIYKQGVAEAKILHAIKDEDENDEWNIVRMHEFFLFRKHICMVMEILDISLYTMIKSSKTMGLPLGIIKRIAKQIIRALKLLRKCGIIHCDLNPKNILLKMYSKSEIKLIDFGSSCFTSDKKYNIKQVKYYRAPEVILGCLHSYPIDMWSLGCILAECFAGVPLFPGENDHDQLSCIMELLGVPPDSLVSQSSMKDSYFNLFGEPILYQKSYNKPRTPGSVLLIDKIKTTDLRFLDFLEECLRYDPDSRLTPSKALKHPWISEAIKI